MPLDGTTYEPRPDIYDKAMRKWSAAARSGRYQQYFGTLYDNTGAVCIRGLAMHIGVDSLVITALGGRATSDRILGSYLNLIHMNNSGMTFYQLADEIDKLADARLARIREEAKVAA